MTLDHLLDDALTVRVVGDVPAVHAHGTGVLVDEPLRRLLVAGITGGHAYRAPDELVADRASDAPYATRD